MIYIKIHLISSDLLENKLVYFVYYNGPNTFYITEKEMEIKQNVVHVRR